MCLLIRKSIVYYYNGAQSYEQFLQVGQLYRALILLGLVLLSFEHLCVFSLHALCIKYICINIFLLTSFFLPSNELNLVRLALDLVD